MNNIQRASVEYTTCVFNDELNVDCIEKILSVVFCQKYIAS